MYFVTTGIPDDLYEELLTIVGEEKISPEALRIKALKLLVIERKIGPLFYTNEQGFQVEIDMFSEIPVQEEDAR